MQLPVKMLQELKLELAYESILLLQSSKDCWKDLTIISATPIINLNTNQSYEIKAKFNSNFLALVCLENQEDSVLNALFVNLENMRETETIFVINNLIDIQDVFKNCFKNGMLNILAMDYGSQEHIYSYRAFPQFGILRRRIGQVQRYFEPQLKDMGGHALYTIPDNAFPRAVVYKDATGRLQITGYLMPVVENFARTLKATLKIYWDEVPLGKETLLLNTTRRLMRTGRVDIPASIVSKALTPNGIHSDVLEITKWQLMLPVESEMDRKLLIFGCRIWAHRKLLNIALMYLFALLLHNNQRLELGLAPTLRCWSVFSDPVLRAMLSQTFVMPRRISLRLKGSYALLMLCSFLFYNVYIAQLETEMVNRPRKPAIRSYQDLRRSGIKVMVDEREVHVLAAAMGKQKFDGFRDVHKVVNTTMYWLMRSQPYPGYAFPITETQWLVKKLKYTKQRRPALRLSNDFIIYSLVLFGIPLPRNSIYLHALNRYILDIQASGLYTLWRRQIFHKLVAIGLAEQLPYYDDRTNCLVRWQDLYYLWLAHTASTTLTILVFACELGVQAVQRWRDNRVQRHLWAL